MSSKANLITPNGYRILKDEEDYLWRIERPEITEKVRWAAGLGDRSDNADYQMNKGRLRKIHSRVRYLRKRLESVQVIFPSKEQEGKVFFGAWVTLVDDAEMITKVQIVGSDEIYKHSAPCSIDSPLARAMLGKTENEEVTVNTPSGSKYYYISNIKYDMK